MQAVNLNTEEAHIKWWAAQDAHMRSIANKSHYDDKDQLRAERMKIALEFMYHGKTYIAYGKQGISLKIDRAVVKNKSLVAEFEQDWSKEGIVKKVSSQGIIYRIKG